MHTYKGYIQSLQIVQGGNQHPDSTPENAMLPSLIALPLLANRLVRKEREGWRLQNWCSRQLSGGSASGVSDIEGCMRCKSVSGAAKLFAHCRASRATSKHSYTVSSSPIQTRTADNRDFLCTLRPGKAHLRTNELGVNIVWLKRIMRRPAHASKVAHCYYWPHINHICGSSNRFSYTRRSRSRRCCPSRV